LRIQGALSARLGDARALVEPVYRLISRPGAKLRVAK
jgi:hypothetical protein